MSVKIKTLSIVIPVFNEEKTVGEVIEAVSKVSISGVEKELIVVDDGSKDRTAQIVKKKEKSLKNITFISHDSNQGKGAAVRTGIDKAKGEYIIIQDADLEYNPQDISKLVEAITNPGNDIVYGTRLKRWPHFANEERRFRFLLHYFGNRSLSLITSALYGVWITDMETCYKLFPKKAFSGIKLRARGFELEPEITAKLLKGKFKLIEVPIKTKPRGYEDGKKLNTFRDGFKALWALLKFRFSN